MKKSSLAIALAFLISMGSLAAVTTANASSSNKFTSTISLPSAPVKINVVLSEGLAYRADHVSPKLRDHRGIRSYYSGWSGYGKYGQKELDTLAERLQDRMEIQLAKSGIEVSDSAANVLNLVIVDARPNRPTFKQMASETNLSMRSYAIGGAKFEGTYSSGGQAQGAVSYGWYAHDITDSRSGSTWRDANRAIDRFARKTAKSIQ